MKYGQATHANKNLTKKTYIKYCLLGFVILMQMFISGNQVYGNSSSNGGFIDSRLSSILAVLKDNKIEASKDINYKNYGDLIKDLINYEVAVQEKLKENVKDYLDSKETKNLISTKPSQVGLNWNFYSIIFLKKDLIFVKYDDGEMFGGELLVKIVYLNDKIVTMNAIWNSAEN